MIEAKSRQALMALFVLTLAACGGSSDNVSPGAIVVEVPVDCDEDCDDGDNGGGNPPPGGGGTVPSVIPEALEGAIRPSGETADDGREIYVIDVTELPGGVLDPEGLLLGNDFVFRIEGGALRVSQN